MNPYTFNKKEDGNVEVLQDGLRISTGTESAAERYGYVPTILSTRNAERNFNANVLPTIQTANDTLGRATSRPQPEPPQPEEIIPDDIKYDGFSPEEKAMQKEKEANDKRVKELEAQMAKGYDDLILANNAATTSQLNQLKTQYEQTRRSLEESNKTREAIYVQSGLRSGQARYAPGMNADMIYSVQREGQARLQELDQKYSDAVAEANAALKQKNYALAYEKSQQLLEIEKETQKTIREQQKEAQKINDEINKENKAQRLGIAISNLLTGGISDPNELFRTLTKAGIVSSPKDISDTLSALMPKDKKVEDLPSDIKTFNWLKENGQISEGETIFDFYRKEHLAKTGKGGTSSVGYGAGSGIGGGGGSASQGEVLSDFFFFMSAIPTKLKDSDADKVLLREYFDSARSRGMSPYQMIDETIGYRIEESSSFSEGMRNHILSQNLEPTEASGVARLINNGKYAQAIQVVENKGYQTVKEQLGEKFISESEVAFVIGKANEINKTLESYGFFDAVGPFAGTFNQALGRLGRRKAAELKAKITTLTQDMQKRQAGSALTESEWARVLEPVVPQLTDKVGVFKTKITENKNAPLQRLNSERSQVELPTINEAELFDRSLRVPAYSSASAFDPAGIGNETSTNSNDPYGLGI